MIGADRIEGKIVVRIGDNELPVSAVEASALVAFLSGDVAARIWASQEPIDVGTFRFVRADERDGQQHKRDVKRRRVIVAHEDRSWHLLPSELTSLGDAVGAQLD